tara:strand:- start:754 stop:903 length:150 start_codon:yes stop_codon:yes gene_type:complete
MQQVNEAVYKWLGRECNWFLSAPKFSLWQAPKIKQKIASQTSQTDCQIL